MCNRSTVRWLRMTAWYVWFIFSNSIFVIEINRQCIFVNSNKNLKKEKKTKFKGNRWELDNLSYGIVAGRRNWSIAAISEFSLLPIFIGIWIWLWLFPMKLNDWIPSTIIDWLARSVCHYINHMYSFIIDWLMIRSMLSIIIISNFRSDFELLKLEPGN